MIRHTKTVKSKNGSRQRSTLYMCQARRKNGSCKIRGISKKYVDELVDNLTTGNFQNDILVTSDYKQILDKIEQQEDKLTTIRNEVKASINDLEDVNKNITNQLVTNITQESVVKRLSDTIANNDAKINQLKNRYKKLNIESLAKLKQELADKKEWVESLSKTKKLDRVSKLNFVEKIYIEEYQMEVVFKSPSFRDIATKFNELFVDDPIKTNGDFLEEFSEVFRRVNKEAIKYWKEYDSEIEENKRLQDEISRYLN